MAIIDASGLFGGDRLRRCSNAAQLHFPRLFLTSDGFGRLELNYARIVGKAYPTFNPIPSETELQCFIQEYVNNYLLFPYEAAGQLWAVWDTRSEWLPRYKTTTDRRSPIPPEPQFTQWKQAYREERTGFPKSFGNISESFLLGKGLGLVRGNPSCPSDDGRTNTLNLLPSVDDPPFGTLDPIPEPSTAPASKTKPKRSSRRGDEGPWATDPTFLAFFDGEFWPAYPRKDAKKRAKKAAWAIHSQRGAEFMRATVLAAVVNQKRPGGRLAPVNGSGFAPYAVTWLNGEEWENPQGDSANAACPPAPGPRAAYHRKWTPPTAEASHG
ncbi:MAG TPA: hypothetical protein VNV82_19665 [Bryobacteraceae bacterium]|nr:hypothetical protein [Bryobacteraceae bacterium]